MIMPETDLKVKILSKGIVFSDKAAVYAFESKAKIQNLVYNKPSGASKSRPQELLISCVDGYQTVVSCVAPLNRDPVIVDYDGDKLIARVNGKVHQDVNLQFVSEPAYYNKLLKNGELVKKYLSSCGLDEMNIFPWRGCAISKGCLFCGVNTVVAKTNKEDVFTAFKIGKHNNWDTHKKQYLDNLIEAIKIAKDDDCFREHLHLIMISGDLSNSELDKQTIIYSEIASNIYSVIKDKATEGIVAVIMPPNDYNLLPLLKQSHIDKIVFNLEVGNEPFFSKYCPGKRDLGLNHIYGALQASIPFFGKGNVWSNFVFGLEPIDLTIKTSEILAKQGIVPSANVLHIDAGNRLDCDVPTEDEIVYYFSSISEIYKQNDLKPYYCAKALRTSLTNEAYDGRM